MRDAFHGPRSMPWTCQPWQESQFDVAVACWFKSSVFQVDSTDRPPCLDGEDSFCRRTDSRLQKHWKTVEEPSMSSPVHLEFPCTSS